MSVRCVTGTCSIDLGTTINFTGSSMTIMVWGRPEQLAGSTIDAMIHKGTNENSSATKFRLVLNSSANLGGAMHTSTGGQLVNAAVGIQLNLWQHFAQTYDGANIRLYYQGVLANTIAKTGTITQDANGCRMFTLGQDPTSRNYEGRLSDMRLYDRAMSSDEILSIYTARGGDTNRTGLIHGWSMKGDTGTVTGATVLDSIGGVNGSPNAGTETWRDDMIKGPRRRAA